jgi:methyltransferase (TIGR00027 family)
LTIYCHAIESQSKDPLLHDPKAVDLTRVLNQELIRSKDRFRQRLVTGRLKRTLVVHIALRARKYDDYVRKFLARYPEGVVVNLGCGMDTRFWRVDNGSVHFYDLDLPEVIGIKRRFFQETARYHFIASSVLDYGWMTELLRQEKGPYLFLAEGVFMYLPGDDVRSLVTELRSKFPGSEIVCEVVNARWAKKPFSDIVSFKMQRELFLGAGARYQSGLRRSDEMEDWSPGIRLLEDWSSFDERDNKLGWMRLFRHFEFFRKFQYTVHYRLG